MLGTFVFVVGYKTGALVRIISSIKHKELIRETDTISERQMLWGNSWAMVKEKPLTGVGLANWPIYFPKYGISDSRAESGNVTFKRAHNDFLSIWAETGPVNMLVYILLFIFSIAYCIRIIRNENELNKKLLALVLFNGLLAYMIFSFFSLSLSNSLNFLFLNKNLF